MSGTLSQTNICNLALMRLGQRKIQNITDQSDPNAIACNVGWQQALSEVSRETPWNCLNTRKYLVALAPPSGTQNPNPIPPPPAPWAPNTNYAVNDLTTYAGQLYQCLIANTSSSSFTIDLTKGYWFQTTIFYPNYLGPYPGGNAGTLYEWAYAYALPTDFILMIELNGVNCWNSWGNTTGSLFEIYQGNIYCNTPNADIKYNRYETDTTKFDSLFTGALVLNLAATIATTCRKDDASLSLTLQNEYKKYVTRARTKNAGESNPKRYSIVSQSRFVGSRYNSTNG